MRLIDADALYERACELEAQALAYVGKIINDETKVEEWKTWSAILTERTAFKHDIYDAPTIEPERKTGRCEEYEAFNKTRLLIPQPERKWIPCSERLPYAEYGESDNVLATCGYRNVEDTSVRWIRELYFNGGNWCYPTGETYEQKVYAWMPLPEPYKEDEG